MDISTLDSLWILLCAGLVFVMQAGEFNELAEGRESRMIELKAEVNELTAASGKPPPYDVSSGDDPEFEPSRKHTPDG